jgi:predicted DNA-binding transcriptional regulator YafY
MVEMMDYLFQQGFENSKRTMQRDFQHIRDEFGVNIVYNRSRNGYYIPEESSPYVDQFLRLANLAQLTQIFAINNRELLNYISFESQGSLRGLHHLTPLLNAIRNSQVVRINHTTFYRKETRTYEVQPYLLKEYGERWYLVGWVLEKNEFRSFGIDRIDGLEITAKLFDRKEHPEPLDFFRHSIGIIYSDQKPEIVELSFQPFQGKYIKTLPLHDSQIVVEDTQDIVRVKLFVSPSVELKRKILSYGSKVKVEKPDWPAHDIAEELKKNIGQYE